MPLTRGRGGDRRGGAPARRRRRRHRGHRGSAADARRRLPRAHRPRRRGAGRGGSRARRRQHERPRLRDRRHARGREAQPAADPAPARPAGVVHDPAGHVRAAVRVRVRRRDPDARLRRLRGLPDAGDHRPDDGVRRLRHRDRALGRPAQGPDRPLPLAADGALGRARRPHARGRGHQHGLARRDVDRRPARRLQLLVQRRSRSSRASCSCCCSATRSHGSSRSSGCSSRRRRRRAQALGFIVLFPLTFASSAFVPPESMPAASRSSRRRTRSARSSTPSRALFVGAPAGNDVWGAVAWCVGLIAVFGTLAVYKYRRSVSS